MAFFAHMALNEYTAHLICMLIWATKRVPIKFTCLNTARQSAGFAYF